MSEKNKLASSLGLFLRRMFDLMVLNILWLLFSLSGRQAAPSPG